MLVSAAIADGPPRRMLELVADGAIELVLAEPVLTELRRILELKLGVQEAAVEATLRLLKEIAVEVVPVPDRVDAVSGDPDDDRILAAAVASQAEILVSGDGKHLLPLSEYAGTRIIKPQALLAELAG